ncbi:hypothetical protein FB451DRAFT_1445952 [Mycena latifolia]|nr:hypothetical protein FB451DRAFT_1445952 [Mycena latifolia]
MAPASSNPSQSVIINTVGPMVLGLMFQQLLFGIIFIQTYQYFSRYSHRDPMFYLALVGALFVLNILEGAMDFHVIYRTVVLHYGDYAFFDLQTWTMWSEPGITAFAGFLAQLFFMERCVRVTKGSWYVILLLALLLLLSLGSGIAVSVSFFKVKLFSALAKIPIPISFWLISTAVTDMTITIILCVSLYRTKTTFPRTESVISKLIRLSAETSAVTAVVAILNLLLYFAMLQTAYHLLPQFSICRVYTLTVLVTLLKRDQLRRELDGLSFASSFAFTRPQHQTMNKAVEVKMTTIVERDHVVPKHSTEPEPRRSGTDSKADTKESIWTGTV